MFEIVRFPNHVDEHGWRHGIVVAIDEVPSIEFSVHKRDLDRLRTDTELEQFLMKLGKRYIELHGDGRIQKPIAEEALA